METEVKDIVGIDASPDMIQRFVVVQKNNPALMRVKVNCGMVENIACPDESFSKVCSVNSIFYWNDFNKGINEIFRILKKGGRFILTYTKKECLEKKGFSKHGVSTFTDEYVKTTLTKNGFANVVELHSQDRYRIFTCYNCTKISG